MNLVNENLPDEDAPGQTVLVVTEHQPYYEREHRFSKDGRRTGRGHNGIMSHFSLRAVQMAGYILIPLTDPKGEPPYVFRFYKNRAGWSADAIMEYSAFFQRYMVMASASKFEEIGFDDTNVINLVIESKSDLVLLRLMSA